MSRSAPAPLVAPPTAPRRVPLEDGRPRASLRSLALAAVAMRACAPDAPPDEPAELRWLRRQVEEAGVRDGRWMEAVRASLEHPLPVDAPLLRLAAALRLGPLEVLAVALAAAVEEDAMAGRVIAHLQAPVGGSRPTVGLLVAAFADALAGDARATDLLAGGAAVGSGLLTLAEGGPLPERSLSVPTHLCLALHGYDGAVRGTTISGDGGDAVPLPPSLLATAERHAAALAESKRNVLVVRTASASEGRAAVEAIAAAMGRRALFIETDKPEALAPWLLLRGLLPVFCVDLAPGERKALPSIPHYDGAVLALCGPDGLVDAGGALVAQWSLPVPDADERRALWERSLGAPALAAELARDHRHGSGRIAHLGRAARHRAALAARDLPTRDDVAAAAWTLEGGGLDALAQALPDPIPDEALVMTPALRADMRALLLRCRARDGLVRDLGVSAVARYRPGVRALFVGPSGTGKTLAAGWLATALALPLYRVDLASVTSKYIGETEKNLAQLLARAEQAEVVLLFDEADSLFGKRTDVRDANDRFANAQTNYLLQRIETFEGIAILTSNSRARFDSAFERRLDMVVEFPLPGPEERRALWQSHLGARHRLTQREINQLAARVDIPGGHIRNAVLTAAVLARAEGLGLAYAHVVQGLLGEYRKLGRQVPAELTLVVER